MAWLAGLLSILEFLEFLISPPAAAVGLAGALYGLVLEWRGSVMDALISAVLGALSIYRCLEPPRS